ncbi:MAG: flavodoxin family protein [Planctomycetaceae bacterium]|nr:flavodoxin family protein [Planctomycetaceae bacterium]
MAKKVVAINGSPRKTWNTATLLQNALDGAAAEGAEVEMVHLYELDFKGCVSCFACKSLRPGAAGHCAMRDGLSSVLDLAASADALVLGSPIYLGAATGEFRSFLERLAFPFITYTDPPASVFTRSIPVGIIYTMNVTEEFLHSGQMDFRPGMAITEGMLARVFGHAETMCSFDTLQFDDYSKVHAPRFDAEAKARRRRDVFPDDCAKAYAIGARFAQWH